MRPSPPSRAVVAITGAAPKTQDYDGMFVFLFELYHANSQPQTYYRLCIYDVKVMDRFAEVGNLRRLQGGGP